MTPKQGVKIVALIDLCDEAIKRKGAYARIIIPMPGSGEKRRIAPNRCRCSGNGEAVAAAKRWATRRLCRRGPRGEIIMHSFNNKKIYVQFGAPELKTSMEEIFYGRTTGKSGN